MVHNSHKPIEKIVFGYAKGAAKLSQHLGPRRPIVRSPHEDGLFQP